MASLPPPLRTVLTPIIDPVRNLLRDLDAPQVPATLHKVVAYTGKRLPPPLLKSLLVELDRNEWLRTTLVESGGDDLDAVVRTFLERPPGWWMAVAGDTAAVATVPVAPDDDEIPKLQAKVDEAKRRLSDLRDENAALRVALRAARKQAHSHDRDRDVQGRLDALEQECQTLRQQLAAETALREQTESKLDVLRRRKERRERPQDAERDPAAIGLRDPIAAARRLDIQAAFFAAGAGTPAATPDAADAAAEVARERPPVELPAGIAPDSVDAIRWLTTEAGPVPIIVDGYNVTFLLDPDHFVTADVRRRLIADLERLVRSARNAHRVLVVFDSALEDGDQPGPSRGGVEVRFATDAESADDEIVQRAAALGGRVVVITNDRELRERVGVNGALALWGDALVAWIEE